MATPSANPSSGASDRRRARLPTPAFIVTGAALAAAGLWIARTPIAESWARTAMADRGVALDLKITRLDFNGADADDVRIGPESDPAFTAQHAQVRFHWRAPWRVEIKDVLIERPHLSLRIKNSGLDLKGLKPLFAQSQDASEKSGGLTIRRIAATNAMITLQTDFGDIVAMGRLNGDAAAKKFAANFSLAPGRLRGPGLDGRLSGGQIAFDLNGGRVNLKANARAEKIMSAAGDAADLRLQAVAKGSGFGGPLADMAGALDLNVTGLGLQTFHETIAEGAFNARFEKGGGPVDRATWKADFSSLGGAWVVAPAASLAGGFSGRLPFGAPLDGRGGWSFTAPEAALGAKAQQDLRKALIDGGWPDPLKEPFAAAAASFLRAGQAFAASASGDLSADPDGVAIRTLQAQIDAQSGAQAALISAPAAPVGYGPKGWSGQGAFSMSGGGAPPLSIALTQISSDKNGVKLNGAARLEPWSAGGASVALNAPELQILAGDHAGALHVRLNASYSGPISGGDIEQMSLSLPADFSWGENSWRLASAECPRIAFKSWRGAGIMTDAVSGAPCPQGGVIAASKGGAMSGRSDWSNVSILARAGDKADAPRLALNVERATISMTGASASPHVLLDLPGAALRVTNRDPDDGRDVNALLSAKLFKLDMAPSPQGLSLDMQTQGAAASFDGTTLGLTDGAGAMKGVMGAEGLNAEIAGITALVRDPGAAPMVTDLSLTGQGRAVNGRIAIDLDALPLGGGQRLADIRITHDLSDGRGRAAASTGEMRFNAARQPQTYFPALRGLVANVTGKASGAAEARWSGAGFKTNGQVNLDGLGFSTFSLGPVDGVNGRIAFDDLLKPSTPSGQRVEAKLINPGVAVEDMSLIFKLQSLQSMQIESGEAKIVGGRVLVEPVLWRFGPQRQEFALQVQQAPIDKILSLFNNPDLKGSGYLQGRIPMSLADGRMRVENARLEAVGAGVLQINVPAATQATADNKFAKLAFDALRDLQFTLLAVDVNGEVDGRLENKLTIQGKSPSASNLPFVYNIGLSAQILPLIQQARYIYDKSAIGDYTRGAAAPPVVIDVTPAPKE